MGITGHLGKNFRKPRTPVGTTIRPGKDFKNPRTSEAKKPLRLSNKFVEDLPAGEMWWDDDRKATGFGVRSYAGGGKSFFIDYRIDGRQRRFTIGPFPRWSADAARERAKELRKEIDRGHDPAGAKRERREAPTVQDLIDRYIADHLPKKSSEAMRVADEKKMLAEIGKELGKHTKVVDVHGGDIGEMHRKISKSIGRGGKPRLVRANRILTVASEDVQPGVGAEGRGDAALAQCRSWQPLQEASNVTPRKGASGSSAKPSWRRSATPWPSMTASRPGSCNSIMLTGCRPSEAMRAQWAEFDKEPGYWIKPSAPTSSNGKRTNCPLSPAALELIERLREEALLLSVGISRRRGQEASARTSRRSGMFGIS